MLAIIHRRFDEWFWHLIRWPRCQNATICLAEPFSLSLPSFSLSSLSFRVGFNVTLIDGDPKKAYKLHFTSYSISIIVMGWKLKCIRLTKSRKIQQLRTWVKQKSSYLNEIRTINNVKDSEEEKIWLWVERCERTCLCWLAIWAKPTTCVCILIINLLCWKC